MRIRATSSIATINVFVLNNTYILNPTHRRDVPLRHEHVRGRQQPAVSDFDPRRAGHQSRASRAHCLVKKFPSLTLRPATRAPGFTRRQQSQLLLVRRQRHDDQAGRIAQPQDRRRLPHHRRRGAENFGQSAGSLHLQRPVHGATGNAAAAQRDRRPAARLSVVRSFSRNQPVQQLREVLQPVTCRTTGASTTS